jgi:hypothetical protein
MLLTAAKMLKENEDTLEGTVKFMFQPAEETFEGAKDMIEHGILDEQATTFGQDSVVDNRCLAHPAEEAVEGTVAFWVGHKIDAQWQFDERDPTRIGLLADITGQHRSIYLYRIRSNTDLVKKEIPLGKVLLAATRTHEYQETEQDSRYPCADISFLPSNDI